MLRPYPDMIVRLNGLGLGKVKKVVGDKVIVSVNSLGGLQIERPINELIPYETVTGQNDDKISYEISNVNDAAEQDKIALRNTIEALRFGLVPESGLEKMTLGYDDLESWAKKCLSYVASGLPAFFEISGSYGTGKSHTLAIIRHIARKNGFLTANVEVDGQNVSFCNPSVFINNLWDSLYQNNIISDYPLLYIYERAIKNGMLNKLNVFKGFEKIADSITTIQALIVAGKLDDFSNYINSLLTCSEEYSANDILKLIRSDGAVDRSRVKLSGMISRNVLERPLDLIQNLAGTALIAAFAGYKGIVITVDEFETEHYDNRNWQKVVGMLKLTGQYLHKKTNLPYASLGIFIGTVDQGGYKGDPYLDSFIIKDDFKYSLKTWSLEEKMGLAEKIRDVYYSTYSLDKEENKDFALDLARLLKNRTDGENELIREFIKWYIMLMDLKYGPPGGQKNG